MAANSSFSASLPADSNLSTTTANDSIHSNVSLSSDPPLTGSPMSPPLMVTEDPGFSPVQDEEESQKLDQLSIDEELSKNPYVRQALESLPDGVEFDEKELEPPVTEEQERRRKWRDEKREEMIRELEKVRDLLTTDSDKTRSS